MHWPNSSLMRDVVVYGWLTYYSPILASSSKNLVMTAEFFLIPDTLLLSLIRTCDCSDTRCTYRLQKK